jgi:hypothetical protein
VALRFLEKLCHSAADEQGIGNEEEGTAFGRFNIPVQSRCLPEAVGGNHSKSQLVRCERAKLATGNTRCGDIIWQLSLGTSVGSLNLYSLDVQ